MLPDNLRIKRKLLFTCQFYDTLKTLFRNYSPEGLESLASYVE